MTIKFALLNENAKVPTRKHPTDAGIDLYIYRFYGPGDGTNEDPLFSGDVVIFHTGVTVEIPKGYFGWITNKSKSDYIIGGGIVDEGYQGELLIKVINPTSEVLWVDYDKPVAQLLIIPCSTTEVEIVDKDKIHKEVSSRGTTGGIVDQV